MISVACDVCGEKYKFADKFLGKTHKCQECQTRFAISEENGPVEKSDEGDSDGAGAWVQTFRILSNIAAAIAICVGCGWMISLLFQDPWDRPIVATTAEPSLTSTPSPPTTPTQAVAAPESQPAEPQQTKEEQVSEALRRAGTRSVVPRLRRGLFRKFR